MTEKNAINYVQGFISSYKGMFGDFAIDDDPSNDCASASSPDGDDNRSMVWFKITDDIDSEFDNRKAFIDAKRKRLGPMGKLKMFHCPSDYEDSYGGILNFKLMGKIGGFFFYTAKKNNVLVFIQAYSTTGKGQISEEEYTKIITTVCDQI